MKDTASETNKKQGYYSLTTYVSLKKTITALFFVLLFIAHRDYIYSQKFTIYN